MPFITALLVSAATQPLLIWLLTRTNVLDHPNSRSSHSVATPRGGGIGIILGVLVSIALARPEMPVWQVLLISIGLAVLGLIDDLITLPPIIRLLGQFGLAGLAGFVLQAPGLSIAASIMLALVWVSGFVNAFNFMDGINGISALSAALAGGYFAVLGAQQDDPAVILLGLVTAGSALGFYPANAVVNRIFLGDVGSYFLGGLIGLTAWLAWIHGAPLLLVLAPLLLYLADTAFTLAQRLLSGKPILEPHRDHVYQRLTDSGFSHASVAWGVFATSATISASLLLTYVWGLPGAGFAVTLLVLIAYLSSTRFLPMVLYKVKGLLGIGLP